MFIEDMRQEECLQALARAEFGRLACALDGQPYVIPIWFVLHHPFLYGFTTAGQKVEWMRANPRVCIEWDEVTSYQQWISVIVFGCFEELTDTPEGRQGRLIAQNLLEQRMAWWEAGFASAMFRTTRQPFVPIYYRVRIDQVTGRRTTANGIAN